MYELIILFVLTIQFSRNVSYSLLRSSCFTSPTRLHNSIQRNMVNTPTFVIGAAGGAAESIAYNLHQVGNDVTFLSNKMPTSPEIVKLTNSIDAMNTFKAIIWNNNGELRDMKTNNDYQGSIKGIMSGKIVIVSDNCGDASNKKLDEKIKDESDQLITKAISILPNTIKSIILCCSINDGSKSKGFLPIFSKSDPYESIKNWCRANSAELPFSTIRYGKLIGGVPGMEPLPFVGLPLLEPELHPSYLLQSVLVSRLTEEFSSSLSLEPCDRGTLSRAVCKLVQKQQQKESSNDDENFLNIDFSVVNIAGNPPTERNWDQLFKRLVTKKDVELLRIDFKSIQKPQQFAQWIADTWFPQAIIDADTATILRGSRPVRACLTGSDRVNIIWEDIDNDLNVKAVGGLEIRISSTQNDSYLSVVRLASDVVNNLPGEKQLLDKLVEAINKVAFKKQYCVAMEGSSSTSS